MVWNSPTSTTSINRPYAPQCAPATEFGAILEKVPRAGPAWSSVGSPPAPRTSYLSSLCSWLLLAAIVAAGWYGWSYWQEQQAPPLPEATAAYVQGAGVDYTSPVTGVGASFAGAPI